MLNLELHKYPEFVQGLAGIAQVETTYTNPLRTMKRGPLFTALQKPLIEPALHLTVALWPLAWLMNLLSYLNGSAHIATWSSGFAGRPPFAVLDFATRYLLSSSPAVIARIELEMLKWDAAAVLPTLPHPALVIFGDRDPTCTPAASARMQQDIPRAASLALSPAKHLGILQQPAQLAQALQGFGAGLRPAGH
jgi:pimeloyl-ACP methyl ester carboxylesterase